MPDTYTATENRRQATRLIEVFHTDADGFLVCSTYEIDAECQRVLIDPMGIHGNVVWGFVEHDDGQVVQKSGVLISRQDGILLG